MSLWERIRNFFSGKDKQKTNEDDESSKTPSMSKNGCKRAPHPYEEVDVDEGGAELTSEQNKFQKAQKAQRQYDEVDIQPGNEGGGVEVH